MKKTLAAILALGISNTGCGMLINAATSDHTAIRATVNQEAPVLEKKDNRYRLMVYNIAHGRGDNQESLFEGRLHTIREFGLNIQMSESEMYENLDNIAELIKFYEPDIVAFNEIDFSATWSFYVDQVKYLAKETNMRHYAYGTKWDFYSLLYQVHNGSAVVSKYPISGKNKRYHKPGVKSWLVGDYAYMDITVEGGEKISVMIPHFDGGEKRIKKQAQTLAELGTQRSQRGKPVVIMGDLNASPLHAGGRGELETITASGEFSLYPDLLEPPKSARYKSMITSNNDGNAIDHIIVNKRFKYIKCVAPKVRFSDHRPIICDVELTPRETSLKPESETSGPKD